MENARPPSPRSPLLLRSRSGASGLTRRPASPSRQSIPLFSSFSNSAPAALTRSHSAAKHRPPVTDPSATPCCLSKENRNSISGGPHPPDPAANLRKPRTAPSAWALSPGRSPPRSTSAPAQRDARKTKTGFSAWARSPSRSTPSPDPSRAAPVATAGGKKGGGGGVLGLFRRRKEAAPGEEESHQLRLLTSRLIQWRFANARAVAAVEAARCNAEEKLFYAWLRIYELRNLVAAKRILVQRRKQKMKLPQILRPQLRLLSQWEPHAKKHVEAVATLVRLLGAAAFSLPLVEGAEVREALLSQLESVEHESSAFPVHANSVSLRRCLSSSMETMTDIAATAGVFYAKVGDIDTMLYELAETIRLEIQGLEELMEMCRRVTSLEMHEVSLRAHMIQAVKEEDELILCPHHGVAISTHAFTSIRVRIMSGVEAPLRPKRKKVLVDYLVQFRWIVVIFVVLPVSCFIYFRLFLGHVRSAMKSDERRRKEHEENVLKVIKRLKQRDPTKDGLVCTARKPYIAVGMRNVDYKRARHFEVDLSAFRNIVEIDKERMIAKVEPLVNTGQITRATISMNLSLAVVAELDDLTVGGLINGYGIEGSSHLYGLFSDTVVAMEVVLADGRLVRCTKDNEHSDLFYGIPWSQGTLGLMVSAEIKLIPVREYMRVTYTPHRGTLKELAQAYAETRLLPEMGIRQGFQTSLRR
ncbi:FAD binding domain [Musa troglodytarum]|uniref:Delta(24)-sterol reductase n=1 Tax=Musa troglodytarum TaxID=320322 RepID=A0A9E7FFQ7_9LILI|nr:FAD binding domain [Musa troglodytarum]